MEKTCPISGPLCKDSCVFLRAGQCEIITIGESLELLAEGLSEAVKYLAVLAEESGKPVEFKEKHEETRKDWKTS